MGRILNMLYTGDLHPADCAMQDSAEYQAMCRESLKEVERFTEKLDAGMKAEFDCLMEHYLELTYLEKSETFCQAPGSCARFSVKMDVSMPEL